MRKRIVDRVCAMVVIIFHVNRLTMDHYRPHPMTNCAFSIIDGFEDIQHVGDIVKVSAITW